MEVTYRANANILGHKAGQIYTKELTPQLKALLLTDKHLSLIDPPTLEVKRPEPPEIAPPQHKEEIKETETKKKSGRKPVETNKDDDDNGSSRAAEEREEGLQDFGGDGPA